MFLNYASMSIRLHADRLHNIVTKAAAASTRSLYYHNKHSSLQLNTCFFSLLFLAYAGMDSLVPSIILYDDY